MAWSRRNFLTSLSRTALVLTLNDVLALAAPLQIGSRTPYNAPPRPAPPGAPSPVAGTPLGYEYVNVAAKSGLNVKTIYGGEHKNRYLLETTGCGVAFFDFDQDDWIDIFLVNGTRLEGFPKGQEPISRLFKNNRDGTFTDVTQRSGLGRTGWGQGCCVGDYNGDGWNDLFVSYYGQNVLYRNNGDGTFTDVTAKAGLLQSTKRWNSGCAFLDYDRDGHLDLFVANYIDFDIKTAPLPEAAACTYKGIQVACGPPGLEGGKNILYRNNGDGTFTDVTFAAGVGVNSRYVAWGCGFIDYDNDGWPDILQVNGHVYPEIDKYDFDQKFKNPRLVYKNLGDGHFKDVSAEMGPGISEHYSSRGAAFGDYDNDGDMDALILNMNDVPSLLRNDGGNKQNWIKIKLVGSKCNRTAIGARVRVLTGKHTQMDEVHSGASVMSQSDLRLHFGLGKIETVDSIEVKWPTTQKVERFANVKANQILTIREGDGIIATSKPKAK